MTAAKLFTVLLVEDDRIRAAGVSDYIIKDMDLKFLERLPIATLAAVG